PFSRGGGASGGAGGEGSDSAIAMSATSILLGRSRSIVSGFRLHASSSPRAWLFTWGLGRPPVRTLEAGSPTGGCALHASMRSGPRPPTVRQQPPAATDRGLLCVDGRRRLEGVRAAQ